MLHLPTARDNLSKYIHAGFPILYIYTYEEAKASFMPNQSLEATLAFLKSGKELNRKLPVIKDVAEQLKPDGQGKSDKVTASLKEIARKIRRGDIDATIVIVSSMLHIPQELEKAFAGIGSGGGGAEVTTRLFGTFLTWMQEKRSAAFVVATANDVTQLPPELLRKGRFDEIFYVALPNSEERRKIFEIHLNKRRRADVGRIDVDRLVAATEGYSGADIEGVVSESIESAFVKGIGGLTTDEMLNCIHNTHSLSEIMKESLEKMSRMYEDRKFKKASRQV